MVITWFYSFLFIIFWDCWSPAASRCCPNTDDSRKWSMMPLSKSSVCGFRDSVILCWWYRCLLRLPTPRCCPSRRVFSNDIWKMPQVGKHSGWPWPAVEKSGWSVFQISNLSRGRGKSRWKTETFSLVEEVTAFFFSMVNTLSFYLIHRFLIVWRCTNKNET